MYSAMCLLFLSFAPGYNKPSTAPKWSPVRKIRPPTSKGLNNLTAKRTLRVIIFRNGNSTESQEMNYEKPSHYTRDVSCTDLYDLRKRI